MRAGNLTLGWALLPFRHHFRWYEAEWLWKQSRHTVTTLTNAQMHKDHGRKSLEGKASTTSESAKENGELAPAAEHIPDQNLLHGLQRL
jgi:hypothetical protein